jgi:hypothetical protein
VPIEYSPGVTPDGAPIVDFRAAQLDQQQMPAAQRSESFRGAEPTRKLGWTDARDMEFSAGALAIGMRSRSRRVGMQGAAMFDRHG